MITGSKEYLDDVAKNYVCSDHLSPVVVAWHAQENSYVLRCGEGHYPEEVTRQLSLTEAYKAGEEVPSFIQDKIERRQRRQVEMEHRKPVDAKFALVPQTDLATGQLLLPEEVKSLIVYAEKYALDPYRGHVVLMYGKPYITIDGYLYHAKKSGQPYTLDSRPLGEEELKDYRAPENAHVWLSRVKLTDTGQEFVGYGVVTLTEVTATSPRDANNLRSPVVAAHPWQLAQKRAEWQAMRRAFPIGESEEDLSGSRASS